MPWNGSGSFSRSNGVNSGDETWQNDRDASTKIRADRHDAHDQDLADGIAACLAKNGENAATADLPMGGFKHTNVASATARNQYASLGQVQDSTVHGSADTGSADEYAILPSPAITAYATYQVFRFIAANANTGASTITVSGLASKSIKKNGDTALEAGDIASGGAYVVMYDGTNFQLLNPKDVYPLSVARGGTGVTSKPSFHAFTTTLAAFTTATWTKIPFDTEEWDSGDFDNSTNYRFTPSVEGKYLLCARVNWSVSYVVDQKPFLIAIYKNGSAHKISQFSSSGALPISTEITSLVEANGTTDYFEIYVRHNTGSDAYLSNTEPYSEFSGSLV